jgi:hypothetical protein
VRVPLVVGTPFEDITVRIDDKVRAIGDEPLEASEVRYVELEGEALVVRLSVKERARVWVVPQPLGAVVWAEWPLEVFTTAPQRLRLRLEAKRVERLEDAPDGGVPMRVLEEGPKVGDTVVLQRSVPVDAPVLPAHASVTPAGVDRVSRSLSLVPPRGPVARPQRLPLWVPPDGQGEAEAATEVAPQVDAPPALPDGPLDVPVVDPLDPPVAPEFDDAAGAPAMDGEE